MDEKCKPLADGAAIKLEDLQQLVSFQRITCEVKVIAIDHAMEVAGGKKKQDLPLLLIAQELPGQLIYTFYLLDLIQ